MPNELHMFDMKIFLALTCVYMALGVSLMTVHAATAPQTGASISMRNWQERAMKAEIAFPLDVVRSQAISRRLEHFRAVRTSLNMLSPSERSLKQAPDGHNESLAVIPEIPGLLFGDEVKCLIQPDAPTGPFFIDGQAERTNITDGEVGVDLYLHLRLVDVNTCMPVERLLVDAWHASPSGQYSGVQGNVGNFLRGMATTDADGIAIFHTVYPGHYPGRCHHIHLLAWQLGTQAGMNTIEKSTPIGVGQIYFDEDLTQAINMLTPYVSNSAEVISNAQDSTFGLSSSTEFDPVVSYTQVGDALNDGVFAWITIGVDLAATAEAQAASTVATGPNSVTPDGPNEVAASSSGLDSGAQSGDANAVDRAPRHGMAGWLLASAVIGVFSALAMAVM